MSVFSSQTPASLIVFAGLTFVDFEIVLAFGGDKRELFWGGGLVLLEERL